MAHFKPYELICIAKLILGNEKTNNGAGKIAYKRHISETPGSSHCTHTQRNCLFIPGLVREACPCGCNWLVRNRQLSQTAKQKTSPQQFLLLKLTRFYFYYLEPKGSKSYILCIYFLLPYTKLFAL